MILQRVNLPFFCHVLSLDGANEREYSLSPPLTVSLFVFCSRPMCLCEVIDSVLSVCALFGKADPSSSLFLPPSEAKFYLIPDKTLLSLQPVCSRDSPHRTPDELKLLGLWISGPCSSLKSFLLALCHFLFPPPRIVYANVVHLGLCNNGLSRNSLS